MVDAWEQDSQDDQDEDGFGDFWVADRESTKLILSKSLMATIKNETPTDPTGDKATLRGIVSNTSGQGEARFDWGTSDEYGQQTTAQAVDGPASVSSVLTGLTPNTNYHYRMVVTDGNGVTRFGKDQTFNSGPLVKDDPCAGGGCVGPAKLRLISNPKTIKVKRGKRGRVATIVVNAGGKAASGVKVCVRGPKKLIQVKRCQTLGGLGSAATKSRTFKVKVKRKAKKGKRISLSFTASAKSVPSRKAKARIVVR